MKRNYISPVAEILDIRTQQMVAASITDDGYDINVDILEPGNAEDACSRLLDEDDDGSSFMNGLWALIVMFMMTLTANAQIVSTVEPADMPQDGRMHAMKLYLKDNTTVEYALDEMEHVTYLPGIGMKVYVKGSTTSVDYLFSQMTKIDYAEDANVNANWEKVGPTMWTDYPEAWRLEYPQMSDNVSTTGTESNSQIVVKRTDDYGITYSLEWDNAKIANRWTCYELHEGNTMATTDRHDDFKADPEVAVSATLADYSGSGFSRGHLCPSADRLCSTEQNKQTFFLTNMQPQYQSHNGGLWSRLETEVRNYATDDAKTGAHCDTLYVVKAATITDKVTIGDDEVDGVYMNGSNYVLCNDRLLVPRYFYMALLHYNKTTDTYHAVAFWTEHLSTTQPVTYLGDYAISIDELERRTGIDFFCNLPDVIEKDVEATVDLEFWNLTTSPSSREIIFAAE